jgi:hypothetical protein
MELRLLRVNSCHLNPLSLWSFVTAATGNSSRVTASVSRHQGGHRPSPGSCAALTLVGNHRESAQRASCFQAERTAQAAPDHTESSGCERCLLGASLPEVPPCVHPSHFSSHQLTHSRCKTWTMASLRLRLAGRPMGALQPERLRRHHRRQSCL